MLHHPDDRITHYSNAEGWFYVCEDGTEVGPFESEWAMFKYMEDRDTTMKDEEATMSEWDHAKEVERIKADPDQAARDYLAALNRICKLDNALSEERNRCARIADGWLAHWSWNPGEKHDCSARGNALTYGRRQAAEVIGKDIRLGKDRATLR